MKYRIGPGKKWLAAHPPGAPVKQLYDGAVCQRCGGPSTDLLNRAFNFAAFERERRCFQWGWGEYRCFYRGPADLAPVNQG